MNPVLSLVLAGIFSFPSLVMISRSPLPIFSLVLAGASLTNPKTYWYFLAFLTTIVIYSLFHEVTDVGLYLGRVGPLMVAFQMCVFFVLDERARYLLYSRSFHHWVAAIIAPVILLEIVYKFSGNSSVEDLLFLIRRLVVSEDDAQNFANGAVMLYFQEQSFVPYFALYLAAVYRFLKLRAHLTILISLILFHRSGTFVLMFPFIFAIIAPRIRAYLLPVVIIFPVLIVMSDEFIFSRAVRVLTVSDIDDSTLSRIIPFLAGVESLMKYPFGVGIGNYTDRVLELLEPYFATPFGEVIANSIRTGWLGYKLNEGGRLSYTSQMFGLFIEFGWPAVFVAIWLLRKALRKIQELDQRYYRLVVLAGFLLAFSFSMPIMFPYAYLALAFAVTPTPRSDLRNMHGGPRADIVS